MKLEDKVVLITGGAGLIGSAFIERVAYAGGIAVIADIDSDAARTLKDSLLSKNGNYKIDVVKINIIDKESINNVINTLHKDYGRIDALVNNAYPRNKNYGRKFEDVTYEDFCENINIHLGGYFLMCQIFSEYYRKQGYGNIINISSIYGVVAPNFDIYEGTSMTTPVEYAAIKSAIIHLTKYIASYYKGKKLRVNSLSLGGLWDNQPESFLSRYKAFALNKGMLMKEDVTGALEFLLSDDSEYINGQNIIVDDGWTL